MPLSSHLGSETIYYNLRRYLPVLPANIGRQACLTARSITMAGRREPNSDYIIDNGLIPKTLTKLNRNPLTQDARRIIKCPLNNQLIDRLQETKQNLLVFISYLLKFNTYFILLDVPSPRMKLTYPGNPSGNSKIFFGRRDFEPQL